MKKILATLTLSGIILSAWTGFAATASAAETGSSNIATVGSPANANSTAEFTIDAGKLTLDKVSDLHFSNNGKNPQISDFVNDQTLTLDGTAVTDNANKAGNSDKQVVVSDFRGSHDGWTLSVQRTDFSNGTDTIKGSDLKLSATGDDTKGVGVANLPKDVAINDANTVFISAAEDTGTFTNNFALDGQLSIPADQNKAIHAGTYQSTVTWTLSTTPKLQAAG